MCNLGLESHESQIKLAQRIHTCFLYFVYLYQHNMHMLSSPSQSMGFHVLGRQPKEILASLATSNSVHVIRGRGGGGGGGG